MDEQAIDCGLKTCSMIRNRLCRKIVKLFLILSPVYVLLFFPASKILGIDFFGTRVLSFLFFASVVGSIQDFLILLDEIDGFQSGIHDNHIGSAVEWIGRAARALRQC
jgi:hypothetical protein